MNNHEVIFLAIAAIEAGAENKEDFDVVACQIDSLLNGAHPFRLSSALWHRIDRLLRSKKFNKDVYKKYYTLCAIKNYIEGNETAAKEYYYSVF